MATGYALRDYGVDVYAVRPSVAIIRVDNVLIGSRFIPLCSSIIFESRFLFKDSKLSSTDTCYGGRGYGLRIDAEADARCCNRTPF